MSFVSVAAGLVSGIAAGMGLGGGTVLLIFLALFTDAPQLAAQGINLLTFVPTAAVAVIIYSIKRKIAWKRVAVMAPLGVLGSFAGGYILHLIPSDLLGKVLGGILIYMGLSRLFSKSS